MVAILHMYKYYFAAASKKFLLEEEPIEEVLRERTNYYAMIGKPIDFWLVVNPDFLNQLNLPASHPIASNSSMAAIISTNPVFINWIKLRVTYVFTGELNSDLFKPELIHH
uniref:hypothetical protein n=1 Tax=Timspurckia oligopyrenoides TaxID=708627 RepID=UPI001FCE1F00|nr:hypothetical protein MW591_pgp006 [Timspurckia oligopyrenoides]UNJ17609.1 hypothetical protein [Timspurckia oligopyrenoides]